MWPHIDPNTKIRLRVKGTWWCQIELEIRGGILSICGAIGEVITRRDLVAEDEIWMANRRHLFIASGCGQIIDDLKVFFPECIPHLQYHLELIVNIPDRTRNWVKKFCSPKQMARIQEWRNSAADLERRI